MSDVESIGEATPIRYSRQTSGVAKWRDSLRLGACPTRHNLRTPEHWLGLRGMF